VACCEGFALGLGLPGVAMDEPPPTPAFPRTPRLATPKTCGRDHGAETVETLFRCPRRPAAALDTASHVLESIEEHRVVNRMLSELAGLDPADERFTAKVTVLVENPLSNIISLAGGRADRRAARAAESPLRP